LRGKSEEAGVRIGIIGCGKIGETYARSLVELGEEVAAVSDVAGDRAEVVACLAGARVYRDYHEMLTAERCDLVCIATPTAQHAEAVRAAATAGAHVLCEKPLAVDLAEARDLVDFVAQRGRVLSVGFKFRFEAAHAAVKAHLTSGLLGAAKHLMLTYFQPLPDRRWYLDEGVAANLLIHVMDLVRWYFEAEPAAVRASALHRLGHRGEDYVLAEATFGDDRRAIFAGGYFPEFPEVAGSEDMVFHLAGTKGYLVCRRPDLVILRDHAGTRLERITPANAFREQLRSLCRHLRGEGPLAVSGWDGLQAQLILEGCRASIAAGGSWVTLVDL
jgi:myo-inositol 2-dehydrogenase/D-chiro-inositol 1-dehydrogenase